MVNEIKITFIAVQKKKKTEIQDTRVLQNVRENVYYVCETMHGFQKSFPLSFQF